MDALPEETLEFLARAIHEQYVRHACERGATRESNPSVVDWDELPETLRLSNFDQARDIGGKLAAVGCEIEPFMEPNADPARLTAEELELLSRMEHDRWCRDRRRDGWTFAPAKDVERRTSPDLVPWEELSEEVREYDRDTVRGLPAMLASAGFRIIRKTGRGHVT